MAVWVRGAAGDGPLLVLLHGLGATGQVWDGVAARWPGGWVIPDLPGHGRSDRLPRYSFGSMAAELAAGLAAWLVAEPAAEPAAELVAKPAAGLAAWVAAEPAAELVAELVAEPVAGLAPAVAAGYAGRPRSWPGPRSWQDGREGRSPPGRRRWNGR